MQIVEIPQDLIIKCMKAYSFPEGVKDVHESIRFKYINDDDAVYYGISFPNEQGQIQYWAGVMVQAQETELPEGIENRIIPAGVYLSVVIKDYMANLAEVQKTFSKLIADPRIDPNGACVERYLKDGDMQCLVRLK